MSWPIVAAAALGGLAAAGLGWGWFEAGWVRLRVLPIAVPGLPPELEGLRIGHLSDFHLGSSSRGPKAIEKAVAWVEERRPDLVVITGDLLARRSGEPALRRTLARLPGAFAVLGNHDFALGRDPFSQPAELNDLSPVILLADTSRIVELRGLRVEIAGLHALAGWKRPLGLEALVDPEADFRILLSHVPRMIDKLKPGWFHLTLAGHMHGGQINIPYGWGKLRLAHLSARYTEGIYRTNATVMHVSPGLGTTFVPFRFLARPEATELVLESFKK
jgi:predicted MPP superfamily phosphohydrolase